MAESKNEKKYTQELWNELWLESDLELQLIVSRSATKLLTETNLGFSEKWDTEGKMQAAADILAEKKRRKEASENVMKEYEETIEQSYRNLKVAHTPNGQLVVSILEEEDEKSAEEIRTWYEELMVLDDSEYYELLNNLEIDGVIYKKEGKYCFYRTCEKNLAFPSSDAYLVWVKKKLDMMDDNDKPRTITWYLGGSEDLYRLIPISQPFYPETPFSDIKYMIEGYSEDYEDSMSFNPRNKSLCRYIKKGEYSWVYGSMEILIKALGEAGLLIKKGGYYYAPLVGEQ